MNLNNPNRPSISSMNNPLNNPLIYPIYLLYIHIYVYLGQGHSNSITSILWLTKALDLNKYLNHDFSADIKNNPDTPESSSGSPDR